MRGERGLDHTGTEEAGAGAPAGAPGAPRAAPVRPVLAVRVVEDEAGLDALERDWNALLERSDASVFQSFEWQRTWWRHFGERRPDARLHVVAVRGRDGLVAIAPFFVERARVLGVLPLRRLLFVGHRDSDYLDVLVARGHEEECAELLADHLTSARAFDVAVLEETPDRSTMGPLLHEAFLRRGWASARFVQGPCPRTALARSWDETLARFDVDDRREARRRLRNARKEHRVDLEVVTEGPEVEPAMREFIELHQGRWNRGGWWGAFADRDATAFHCEAAERLARRGWLFVGFLRVDDRRWAVNYGFQFRDAVAVYLTGSRASSPDLARHSPGRLVHALCMQWAIERGRPVYDFMRGAEPYKYELGAVDVPNWMIVAYPRPSRLTAATHRAHKLVGAARRRAAHEAHALRVASRSGGGWLSPAVRAHLARAARRWWSDLRRYLSRGMTP